MRDIFEEDTGVDRVIFSQLDTECLSHDIYVQVADLPPRQLEYTEAELIQYFGIKNKYCQRNNHAIEHFPAEYEYSKGGRVGPLGALSITSDNSNYVKSNASAVGSKRKSASREENLAVPSSSVETPNCKRMKQPAARGDMKAATPSGASAGGHASEGTRGLTKMAKARDDAAGASATGTRENPSFLVALYAFICKRLGCCCILALVFHLNQPMLKVFETPGGERSSATTNVGQVNRRLFHKEKSDDDFRADTIDEDYMDSQALI